MANKPIYIGNVVKAAHLVLMGYGHWMPNDPRGSGSAEIRQLGLERLGPIHFGRKRVQPGRAELKAFHREAEQILQHDVVWFDEEKRNVIGEAIARVVREMGYTVWAAAVLTNHWHLVVRTHRDDSLTMLCRIAEGTFHALHERGLVPEGHPVWADRPYKVFLRTRDEVLGRIDYVEKNPMKEGLARQHWEFVKECML
jgi:REP element-mobilizing transposase RayT